MSSVPQQEWCHIERACIISPHDASLEGFKCHKLDEIETYLGAEDGEKPLLVLIRGISAYQVAGRLDKSLNAMSNQESHYIGAIGDLSIGFCLFFYIFYYFIFSFRQFKLIKNSDDLN